jgi:hypothetical protein
MWLRGWILFPETHSASIDKKLRQRLGVVADPSLWQNLRGLDLNQRPLGYEATLSADGAGLNPSRP